MYEVSSACVNMLYVTCMRYGLVLCVGALALGAKVLFVSSGEIANSYGEEASPWVLGLGHVNTEVPS